MQDGVSLVKEDCQNEAATMEKMLNDKDFTDVTLVSKDGQKVSAHRAVLCSQSSFLRGILMESLHQSTVLYLGKADHQVLQALVQFVYLSSSTIPNEKLSSLAEMAKQLGFDDLERAIEKVSKTDEIEQDIAQSSLEVDENFHPNEDVILNESSVPSEKIKIKCEESKSWNTEEYKEESDMDTYKNLGQSKLYQKLPKIEMIPPNSSGGYSCNECNRLCSSWTKLKHHILQVHEGYLYKCTKCEEQFGSVLKIESHHVEKHGKASFRCEVCEKLFTHCDDLRRHVGEGEFKCKECKFMGCTKTVLANHAKIHDSNFKDGVFNCNLCPYQNKKRSRIGYHKKYVHDKVKESCDQCAFKSSRKDEVVKHQKVKHEGLKYKCDRCDYTANRSYSVTHHNAVKHNGLRYECTLCDYKSISTSGLQDHIIAMHDKTAFSCPFCTVQVFYKNSLQRHIKQHTKMKLEALKNYEASKKEETIDIVENGDPQGLRESQELGESQEPMISQKPKKSQKTKPSQKVNESQATEEISHNIETCVTKSARRKKSKKSQSVSMLPIAFMPNCVSLTCCRISATKGATPNVMENRN